jgi:hypothetical protein
MYKLVHTAVVGYIIAVMAYFAAVGRWGVEVGCGRAWSNCTVKREVKEVSGLERCGGARSTTYMGIFNVTICTCAQRPLLGQGRLDYLTGNGDFAISDLVCTLAGRNKAALFDPNGSREAN